MIHMIILIHLMFKIELFKPDTHPITNQSSATLVVL